jgi:hypothetical protein
MATTLIAWVSYASLVPLRPARHRLFYLHSLDRERLDSEEWRRKGRDGQRFGDRADEGKRGTRDGEPGRTGDRSIDGISLPRVDVPMEAPCSWAPCRQEGLSDSDMCTDLGGSGSRRFAAAIGLGRLPRRPRLAARNAFGQRARERFDEGPAIT